MPSKDVPSESTPTQTQNQTEVQQSNSLMQDEVTAQFEDQIYTLEVANTDKKREAGLMYRTELARNHGMIFEFDEPSNHAFWMKDTLIPLDIIWLSKNQQVIHYVQAEPCVTEHCTIYKAGDGAKALYIIELSAGTFTGKIGDYIDF